MITLILSVISFAIGYRIGSHKGFFRACRAFTRRGLAYHVIEKVVREELKK
jgi:hypothetical protein